MFVTQGSQLARSLVPVEQIGCAHERHSPAALQVWLGGHVPQTLPRPSEPQVFPEHCGVQQAPEEHSWPEAHFEPHPPQSSASVWELVQKAFVPLPQALGVAVGQAQVELEHCWPLGQVAPQLPQLLASTAVLAQ
jgi:hypothetical protein